MLICTLRVNDGETHYSPITHLMLRTDLTVRWSETIILAIMRSRRKNVDEVQMIHNISNIMIVSLLSPPRTKKNDSFLAHLLETFNIVSLL